MKQLLWILFVLLAIAIGLYPVIYFLIDRHFGLLGSKSLELLADTFWNIGFYTHIVLGGLALLVGWAQFSAKLRQKSLSWHRRIGKFYVLSVLLSGTAGFSIAFYATGGLIPQLGFQALALIWLSTTIMGFLTAKKQQITAHQKWMTYSYAACFSAVTLRIWLPLLTGYFQGDFIQAYTVVAWLCWIPNLIVAYILTASTAKKATLG